MPRKPGPTKTAGSPRKLKQQTLLSHFPSSPPMSPQKKATNSKPRKAGARIIPIEDSESDTAITESAKRKRARFKQRSSFKDQEDSDSSDVGKIHFEARSSSPQTVPTGQSSSEAEVELLSPSQSTKRPRILYSDSDENGDEKHSPRLRFSRRLTKKDQQEDEHSSESDASRSRKGRLVKGKSPSSGDEDEDILSGIDEEQIIGTRLRGQSSQKSRFLQNLERLKKKKRGLAASESEEAPSDDNHLIPGARHNRQKFNDEESGSGENGQDSNSEGGLDDFIVEDEGGSKPAALPAMFSMNTHQDLAHHFKVVCQYLVHLAVTTPTARSRRAERLLTDEYFSVPLSITRRKLADIRDSIASSVWRPAYKKALLTYPDFALHDLDFAVPHCDACHLGGRLSTFVAHLSGDPYDRTTFQSKTVESGSSSDSSDAEQERRAPQFNLGRFCARRTEVFHELCHWEYELFRALSREVEELSNSERGFVRIAYAGGIEPPDDVSDADQVMEWLDQRGVVNTEWLKVKQLMSRATGLEADVKRGKQDD